MPKLMLYSGVQQVFDGVPLPPHGKGLLGSVIGGGQFRSPWADLSLRWSSKDPDRSALHREQTKRWSMAAGIERYGSWPPRPLSSSMVIPPPPCEVDRFAPGLGPLSHLSRPSPIPILKRNPVELILRQSHLSPCPSGQIEVIPKRTTRKAACQQ
jgi:hypothetical protein